MVCLSISYALLGFQWIRTWSLDTRPPPASPPPFPHFYPCHPFPRPQGLFFFTTTERSVQGYEGPVVLRHLVLGSSPAQQKMLPCVQYTGRVVSLSPASSIL